MLRRKESVPVMRIVTDPPKARQTTCIRLQPLTTTVESANNTSCSHPGRLVEEMQPSIKQLQQPGMDAYGSRNEGSLRLNNGHPLVPRYPPIHYNNYSSASSSRPMTVRKTCRRSESAPEDASSPLVNIRGALLRGDRSNEAFGGAMLMDLQAPSVDGAPSTTVQQTRQNEATMIRRQTVNIGCTTQQSSVGMKQNKTDQQQQQSHNHVINRERTSQMMKPSARNGITFDGSRSSFVVTAEFSSPYDMADPHVEVWRATRLATGRQYHPEQVCRSAHRQFLHVEIRIEVRPESIQTATSEHLHEQHQQWTISGSEMEDFDHG